ncbi:MAG TPA: hypothetical protein VIF82_18440 [Burkholderiaceae bacterium]
MKRPLSVWITLILLTIALIVAIPATFYGLYKSFGFLAANFNLNSMLHFSGDLLLRLALIVPVLIVPVLAVRGIIQRTKIGRLAGIVSLIMYFILIIIGSYLPNQGPIHRLEYSNAAQRSGGEMANIVGAIAFFILQFRFGFSNNSKKYFNRESPNAAQDSILLDSQK